MAEKDVTLPKCLMDSMFYRQLSEVQQRNYLYRQIRIKNICVLAESLTERDIGRDLLEELTLELYVCLSLGQTDVEVSPWLIQEMWNSDFSKKTKRTDPQAVANEYGELSKELMDSCQGTIKDKIRNVALTIHKKQQCMLESEKIETFFLLQMVIESRIPLLLSLSIAARFELDR